MQTASKIILQNCQLAVRSPDYTEKNQAILDDEATIGDLQGRLESLQEEIERTKDGIKTLQKRVRENRKVNDQELGLQLAYDNCVKSVERTMLAMTREDPNDLYYFLAKLEVLEGNGRAALLTPDWGKFEDQAEPLLRALLEEHGFDQRLAREKVDRYIQELCSSDTNKPL